MNKLESIGLGLFSVPKLLENNLEAGIKALAELSLPFRVLAGDLSKPLTSKRNQSQASIAAGAGYSTLNCRINHSVVFVSSSWSPSGDISKFIFMNRKNFLKTASLFALSAPYSSTVLTNWLPAMNKLESIGLGLFSVPKLLENNLEAGIKALAELGITEFETYGPYSFFDVRNKKFWNEVTPGLGFSASEFYGKTAAQFNEILGNYGVSVPALHTDLYTLEENAKSDGTVVRWASAFALGEILKLKLEYNTALLPQIEKLSDAEEDNGVKNKYLGAIRKIRKQ